MLIAHSQETSDAPVLAAIQNTGKDQVQLRDAAAGDPVFFAVEHIAAAYLAGRGGHLGRGRSGIRFGNADRWFVAAQHQFGSQLFLCLGAIGHDRRDATHIGLDHDPGGDGAAFGDLLDDDCRIEKIAALAAKFGWDGHPHQARLAQGGDVVPRVFFGPVDLGRTALEQALGQFARLRLKLLPRFA